MGGEGGPDVQEVLARLQKQSSGGGLPGGERRDPYMVLIACLLSLRTKDEVTDAAARRLFRRARTPRGMLKLRATTIRKLIFPVGFYRVKARTILEVSREVDRRFRGKVPADRNELLQLKGVGRKTANLVLGSAYGVPAICVDTHVHRISNRTGLVSTRTADETERELERVLPAKAWVEINSLMVRHGQTVCKPISPLCSRCEVAPACRRVGVQRSR